MEFQCRLCLEEDSWWNVSSPCKCNGSIRYVHKTCLKRYNEYRESQGHNSDICPTCTSYYLIWGEDAYSILSTKGILFITLLLLYPNTFQRNAVQCTLVVSMLQQVVLSSPVDWTKIVSLYRLGLPLVLYAILVPSYTILLSFGACIVCGNQFLIRHTSPQLQFVWRIGHVLLLQVIGIGLSSIDAIYLFIYMLLYLEFFLLALGK
jgi:hypothetical protein